MNDSEKRYPSLPRSYKNKFPFKIGAPSFIYPDAILPNVKMLAPFVEEIELILFESRPMDGFPDSETVRNLADIARTHGLEFNIHLPIDMSLSHPDLRQRRMAHDITVALTKRFSPLCPSTYTLHFPCDAHERTRSAILKWQEALIESMSRLATAGVDPARFSIETLDYPFEWVVPVIEAFECGICLDLGHLIVHGYDLEEAFDRYLDNTAVVHLHGVSEGRDHLGLDTFDDHMLSSLLKRLSTYKGTVSIEVFSYERLSASLETLEHWFRPVKDRAWRRSRLKW